MKVGPVPAVDAAPIVPQYFAYSGHRGMRRVLVDLKDPDGREAFLSLAAVADVVVESFRPGVVDRLGVGYAAVSERNPGVIYCSTSGYVLARCMSEMNMMLYAVSATSAEPICCCNSD